MRYEGAGVGAVVGEPVTVGAKVGLGGESEVFVLFRASAYVAHASKMRISIMAVITRSLPQGHNPGGFTLVLVCFDGVCFNDACALSLCINLKASHDAVSALTCMP